MKDDPEPKRILLLQRFFEPKGLQPFHGKGRQNNGLSGREGRALSNDRWDDGPNRGKKDVSPLGEDRSNRASAHPFRERTHRPEDPSSGKGYHPPPRGSDGQTNCRYL